MVGSGLWLKCYTGEAVVLLASACSMDVDFNCMQGWVPKQVAHGYENGVLFTALLLPNEWLYVPPGYWSYVLSVAESAAMLTIVTVPHVVPKAFALLPKARRAGIKQGVGE